MAASDDTGPPIQRVGRYELLYRFASGGMADLYLARLGGEEGVERIVAVKLIHAHLSREPEFVKMFIDEARLASRLSHPNIALTLELGRFGATHFIAMEYVDGESVSALLHRTRPPIPYCARIIADAAAGLHAAHELRGVDGETLNVVHRDVSPQNILVSYDGAVKVVDFGVARARGSLHTSNSAFKGKFQYMSPEQFSDPRSMDRRTDIFALGVVLYEATTWTRLFRCESEAETIDRVLRGEIRRPTEVVPSYPPELERIVLRALERPREARQQSAQELHEELELYIAKAGEPVSSLAIAKMMREVFADRIQEKRELLEQSESRPSPDGIPTVELISASSVILRPSAAPFLAGRRRTVAIVALLGLAIAALLVVLLFPGGPTPTAARASDRQDAAVRSPEGPRRVVTIRGSARPPAATITLAGKPLSNPFELRQRATSSVAELVVSAPGFVPQRLEVPLSVDGTWAVDLVAEPVPADRKGEKKKTEKKIPGRKKVQTEFLDNPYRVKP